MNAEGIIQIALMLGAGFIIQAMFARREKAVPFGRFVFLSLTSSVMLLVLAGFLLMLPSVYSLWSVIGLEYLIFASVIIHRILNPKKSGKRRQLSILSAAFPIRLSRPAFKIIYIPLIIVFIFVCNLYMRPAEYIHGGFDPGIYINSGANLAETGSPFFTDEIVKELGYQKARRFLGMFTINPLGVSIISQFDGRMASQFYPGLSVVYAFAYETAGYDFFLYIQPLISLLSLFALYYFTSSVFGRGTAALAGALYSFNLIPVWFARYPVAEPLTILLIATGLYLLLEFYKDGIRFNAVSSGMMFAAALLTRPDAALILLPLSVFALYRYIWKKWRSGEVAVYLITLAGFAASIFYAVFYTGGYLRGVFISFIGVSVKKERALMKAGILLLLFILALAVLFFLLKKREKIAAFFSRFRRAGSFIPTAAACILLSLVLFQFFIRPALPFAFLSPHDNSLVRLGMYFAPLSAGWDRLQGLAQPWSWLLVKGGVLIAALAAVYAVEKARDYRKALFHFVWIPYALLYFQDLRIEPVHFWLNRRYLMFILFGLIASLCVVISELWRKKAKQALFLKIFACALISYFAVNFALGTAMIARNKEWKGMRTAVGRFDASLPKKTAVIIDGSAPYTLEPLHLPLMTFFCRRVSTLKNNSVHLDSLPVMCEQLAEKYGNVIYITPETGRAPRIPGRWGLIGTHIIETRLFEVPDLHEYRPPEKAVDYKMPVNAYIFISKHLRAGNGGAVDVGSEGDIFITGDWFAREEALGTTFRWCGASAGFVTYLEKDAKSVEITAASGRMNGAPPAKVTLLVNGREAACFTADPFFKTYRFPLPPGVKGDIELTIKTTTWKPAGYGIPDNRKLGLKIDFIQFVK